MRQPFDCHMLHVTCYNTGVIVHCNAAEGRAAHVAGVCIVAVNSMNLFDAGFGRGGKRSLFEAAAVRTHVSASRVVSEQCSLRCCYLALLLQAVQAIHAMLLLAAELAAGVACLIICCCWLQL